MPEANLHSSEREISTPAISFRTIKLLFNSSIYSYEKTLSSILLGLTLATGAVTAQTNFRSIDFNEALKQSQAENKLVFIDFYTDWCGPCRKMSKEVFPQKQVGDYFNAQFVCIKLNAEKEGEELAQKFEVKAYPTFIIADQQGNTKATITGAFPADAFVAKVKNELNPEMAPERMKQRYESGERTPELVDAYAMSFMEQKKMDEGYKIIDDYFNSLSDKQKLAPENLFVFTRYTFDVSDPKCQFWTKNVEKADSKTKEIALAHLQKLYHSATSTYLSGYVFAENKFNEAEYQQLKQDIYSLKLDQKYPFAPVFELIECYAKGDKKAYFEMFKQKKSELDSQDFELILLNVSRLFPNSPELMPEVIKYVRASLPELRGSSIMMLGRVLMNLEKN